MKCARPVFIAFAAGMLAAAVIVTVGCAAPVPLPPLPPAPCAPSNIDCFGAHADGGVG